MTKIGAILEKFEFINTLNEHSWFKIDTCLRIEIKPPIQVHLKDTLLFDNIFLSNTIKDALLIILIKNSLSDFIKKRLVLFGSDFVAFDSFFIIILENYKAVHDLLDSEIPDNFELFPLALDMCHSLVEKSAFEYQLMHLLLIF